MMSPATLVSGIAQRLSVGGLMRTAAALSFTTVLGLVPLFTVAFIYVARYPLFERWLTALEGLLLRHLLPGSSASIRPWLEQFSTRAAELQGVGIAIVVVTALLLVATIESEINVIWGARESRSLLRRPLIYVVGVTLGPLAVGAAIHALNLLLEASVSADLVTNQRISMLSLPIAIVLGTLAFSFLYKVLPARRVPLRPALLGGLVAAVAFELAKRGFVFYMANVPTYERVYGALSVLPLFLLWIFVSWIVVLFGAAVTATLAEGPLHARSRRSRR